jgi:hypothetical protein
MGLSFARVIRNRRGRACANLLCGARMVGKKRRKRKEKEKGKEIKKKRWTEEEKG